MADRSKIEWTDATVNFWWGCSKVGPGCDHCYAEAFDRRTGGSHWGQGVPRRKIKGAVKLLHRLDNAYADWAAYHHVATGNAKAFGLPPPGTQSRRRVFVQSMADLFDLEVPIDWFREAWETITVCDRLSVQILTKRVSVVQRRLKVIGLLDWPQHAGLIITVVNQAEADRDIPRLMALKKKLGIPWVGLSMEPLLGPVRLDRIVLGEGAASFPEAPEIKKAVLTVNALTGAPSIGWQGLDWVIVGGESGPGARPLHPDWARSLRDQCQAANVAFFFKQWGAWKPVCDMSEEEMEGLYRSRRRAKDGEDQDRLDECWGRRCTVNTLCLRGDGNHVDPASRLAFLAGTRPMLAFNIGKRRAGRLLDGVEHNGMPA